MVALTFLSGGLIGVLGAQLIEPSLVRTIHIVGVLAVALSEELAKALAILWLARARIVGTARHGLLLGAAAGMGFAAFETMGHAFRALLTSPDDRDLITQVLLTRALLSPLAHATWTALIVGVFWREGRRITPLVATAFLAAVGLHAVWNWSLATIPLELVLPGVNLHIPLPALVVGLLGFWLLGRVQPRPARMSS
jgi:RsiW-degrading membrane proteinase PrsW (M82 family)